MQVVLSRMQNRRGTQAEFDNLAGDQRLLPGEIGYCTDTNRLFIGTDDPNSPNEISMSGDSFNFDPLVVYLSPTLSWLPVGSLSFTPAYGPSVSVNAGLLNILYSLIQATDPATPITTVPFTKSGTLTVSATTVNSIDTFTPAALLSDSGVEINPTTNDISFMAEYVGGTIQILYKHNFSTTLKLSTSTIHWVNFES